MYFFNFWFPGHTAVFAKKKKKTHQTFVSKVKTHNINIIVYLLKSSMFSSSSNIVKLVTLAFYGGVWVKKTCMKLEPLCLGPHCEAFQ